MPSKDMSQREFNEACKRYGFRQQGFLGYYDLGASTGVTLVSVLNAGHRRRDQLKYLIEQKQKAEAKRKPQEAASL